MGATTRSLWKGFYPRKFLLRGKRPTVSRSDTRGKLRGRLDFCADRGFPPQDLAIYFTVLYLTENGHG